MFTLRLYGGTQNYYQTFSSIAANRNSESLTNVQRVPVQQMGLIAQWSKQVASRLTLLAGLDGMDVTGFSDEISYSARQADGALVERRHAAVAGRCSPKASCRSHASGR